MRHKCFNVFESVAASGGAQAGSEANEFNNEPQRPMIAHNELRMLNIAQIIRNVAPGIKIVPTLSSGGSK